MTMMSNKKNNDIVKETFYGYIENTRDSLLLFEACKRGIIPRITRRLQDRERYLIRSGSIFCFDENESGIKRWTDGLVWSPSRILGNFLIYREMDDKKTIRNGLTDEYGMKQSGIINVNNNIVSRSQSALISTTANEYMAAPDVLKNQREKALIGSLKNSSRFKRNGLIKKSMSLIVDGVQQHIVSYYSKEDVLSNRLRTPSSVMELSSLEVSPGLRLRQNFRIPILLSEETSDDRFMDDYQSHNTSLKRKYSDMTQQTPFETCSSNSPYSPPSTISNSSCESAYSSLFDSQSQQPPQFFAVEPSTVIPSSNLYASAPRANSAYSIAKSNINPMIQQISSSHVNNNINNKIHQQVIPNQSNHIPVDNTIVSQNLLCNNISNEKKQTLQKEDIDLTTNLLMTSGILLESKSEEKNSGMMDRSNNISFGQKVGTSFKRNITTAQSFSNTNKKTNKMIQTTPSSYNQGMPLNFSSESAVNINTSLNRQIPKGGYYSSTYFDDYHQEQNPHQHLFSSSSFHAINHASIPYRAEVATNSFMLDMNVLLGTGWNEFELQM